MVQIIKDMDELKTFLKAAGSKLVVVEFSAKWCGPCQKICPLVHDLAQIYHVKVIPTFQMFKKAQKVTLISRLKRAFCCNGSGIVSKPYLSDNGNE
uniref:Thioredoxin domain containing 8 n=1 Tax=Neovison vison TaxID=452646 RepID=A0A8C7AT92_NEOVI